MTGKDMGIALWVVLLWSMNLIIQKIAVSEVSVFVLSFLRVVLVFPLLFFYPKPSKNIWEYFLCGFFLAALYLILFGFGLKTDIGAGLSAFFVQMQVFFVILCCYLILGEKPSWFQVIGILTSFIGVYFLKAVSSPAELPFLGILLLIGSCVSYGIGISLSKKFKIGQSLEDITWMSMTASVPLFITCLIFEGPLHTFDIAIHMSSVVVFCILFAVIASTVWATYLWLRLLQKAPASSVATFMLLLPIFSNIISNIILGETLTPLQVVSGFIIILGVIFAQGFHQRVPILVAWLRRRVA